LIEELVLWIIERIRENLTDLAAAFSLASSASFNSSCASNS
jgi:hypothetical protein